MRPKTALTISLVAAALAIALVILDTVYSLEARLQTQESGQWVTVAETPYRDGFGGRPDLGCAGRTLRFTLDNHRPFAATASVRATFYNQTAARDEFVIKDTWHLERFSSRQFEFTVPTQAFLEPTGANPASPKPGGPVSTSVQVVVGDLDPLYTCVNRGQ